MPNTISKINGYHIKDNISGYTTNTGTITGVSVNGTSVATSGTANIPLATTTAPGVMSATDKSKLDSMSNTLITANATTRVLTITTTVSDGDAVSY